MKSVKELLAEAGPGAYVSRQDGPRAHRLVAKQAKEFCMAIHEKYSGEWPEFASRWPDARAFAKKFWPHFTEEARATLARLLPKMQNPHLQNEIHDALIKDQSLRVTRANVPQVLMDV